MVNPKPNIVLIVMDTARAQNLSCYGYERETTPFLDRLAEEGVKYERCVSPSCHTLPSHAALFSGKYPHEVKMLSNKDYFDPESTLAQILSKNGYKTIGISNNPFVSSDFGLDKGFDDFTLNQGIFKIQGIWGGEKKEKKGSSFKNYLNFFKKCVKNLKFRALFNGIYYLLFEDIIDKIKDKFWLGDDGAKTTNRLVKKKLTETDKPFFLFINYMEVHGPYRPPKKFSKHFIDIDKKKANKIIGYDSREAIFRDIELSENDIETLKALYDSELFYLDSKIRELYEWFKETGNLENTVFIVTSDHGEFFGEHGLYKHHGGLYQEVLHVPLIIKDYRHNPRYPRSPEEVFEMRWLYQYILALSKNKESSLKEKRYATAVYSGLDDHSNVNLKEEYPDFQNPKIFSPVLSLINEEEKLIRWASGEEEIWELDERFLEDSEKDELDDLPEEVDIDFTELKTDSEREEEMNKRIKKGLEKLGYSV